MSKKNKNNRNGSGEKMASSAPQEDKWEDLDDDLDTEDEVDDGVEDEDDGVEDDGVEDVVEDDEGEIEIEPQYYTVTNGGYTIDGAEVRAGQKIRVSCQHCALWQQPLAAKGGKVLCRPGEKTSFQLDDDIVEWEMRKDRFSCQQYFVPKDIPAVLDFLQDDVDAVSVLRYAFPVVSAVVKMQVKFAQYCEKHNIDNERADALLDSINNFAYLFSTDEQVGYVRPLVSFLSKKLKAKHRRLSTPRRAAFSAGDDVIWTDKSGTQVSGFIRTIGGPKKKVSLIVVDDDAVALRPELAAKRIENPKARIAFTVQYDIDHWLGMDPKVVSEAIVYQD